MSENQSCPIWGTRAATKLQSFTGQLLVDSLRAGGEYIITGEARSFLPDLDDYAKARLTSWMIDQRRLGTERPRVLEDTLEIEGIQRKNLSVSERAERLLHYIEDITSYIGQAFVFTSEIMDTTAIAAWSESVNFDEVKYLLDYLCKQGWVERIQPINLDNYVLTVEGHGHLAELRSKDIESSTAFVAMWFHDSTSDAWERGIKLGIEDIGYEALRIDKQEHNNKIDDEIIAAIRRSRFVVADFTQGKSGARGGVYYEAGFARGLGIEVISTCKKDMLKKIHFDTRQYNHIAWKTPEELREKLAFRISATIGDGPLKKRHSLQTDAIITIHHYDYGNRWFWALHPAQGPMEFSSCDCTSEGHCKEVIKELQASGDLPQCSVSTMGPQTPPDSGNRPICD